MAQNNSYQVELFSPFIKMSERACSAESSWDQDGFIVLGGGEDDISDVLFSISKLDRWVRPQYIEYQVAAKNLDDGSIYHI